MKKYLMRIFLFVLTFIVAASFIGCTPATPKDESEEISSEEISSEESSESIVVPEPIVGAGASGEINLEGALELLDPILDNDYANINLSVEYLSEIDGVGVTLYGKAIANVKRTVRGYDLIANIEVGRKTSGYNAAMFALAIYYVDGVAVTGAIDYMSDAPVMEYELSEVGSFNGMISMLNQQIAADPDLMELYGKAMPVVEMLKSELEAMELESLAISGTVPLKDVINSAISYLKIHKDDVLYDFILEEVLAIDPTDTEAAAEYEAMLKSLAAENPSVWTMLDAIVNEFAAVGGTQTVGLEELLIALETELGISVQELHAMIVSEIPDLAGLPVPEEGDTLYTYAYRHLSAITLNDIAEMIIGEEGATGADVIDMIIAMTKGITLGEVVNTVANALFGDLLAGFSPDGSEVDVFAVMDMLKLEIQTVTLGYVVRTDELSRPTVLAGNAKVQISYADLSGDGTTIITTAKQIALSLEVSYTKPYVEFEIPEDVLDLIGESSEGEM